jgi:hypothetical protein
VSTRWAVNPSPAEFWVHTEDAERARTLLDGLDAPAPKLAADPNDDA